MPIPAPDPLHAIVIRGARQHNLKNIDLVLPRDRFVVLSGLSGSGKSSLAFDTLYAEGQRRYVESLSTYARQFLEQMQKPDVEHIAGLPPTIAIQQRAGSSNPRSTVATTTEIYDYLRVLFARAGAPFCPKCARPIARQSPEAIADQILAQYPGARIQVLAPLIRGRKGEHREVLRAIVAQGYVRARVDGLGMDVSRAPALDKRRAHTIEAVVDRLEVQPGVRGRLHESVEQALKLGEGVAIVAREQAGKWVDTVFSEKLGCPDCLISLEELEPRIFSFNSPYGACATCNGLGTKLEFDPELVIPDPELSISRGAVSAWRGGGRRMTIHYNYLLRHFCADYGIDPDLPVKDFGRDQLQVLLHGSAKAKKPRAEFEGVIPNLERRFTHTESEFVKHRLSHYLTEGLCPVCKGARLKPTSLAVRVGGRNIREVCALSIQDAQAFFGALPLDGERAAIARPILREIQGRLGFLVDVGLGYLSLDRTSGTLSGGEAQRIRLGTQVGSGLVGVCYVLDEPTIGLHQRDNARLVSTLLKLRDQGNTVIVVEHDEQTIRAADHLVDMGPGAGAHGGQIVAQGSLEEILAHPDSPTGAFLSGRRSIALPSKRRDPEGSGHRLRVRGARENNLKRIDVAFPLGLFICVTGVSGSGKSTLVNDILFKGAARKLTRTGEKPGAHDALEGVDWIDKVIAIDQSPIGRTPRSNAATYTGVFDPIRKVMSLVTEARIRGFKPGRFSFNVKGGRCEACQGQGTKLIEMHFLPDVYVTCEACRGTRYNKETLEVRYRGKTIAEILEMRVDEAVLFFKSFDQIQRLLKTLRDVGLGYLPMGQSSTTLSGGEAQRVKLATELGKTESGHSLYIMDEPTTGLHFADIANLLDVIQRLVARGNTMVVIEHNLDVIKTADWIIDLGPEGGEAGGRVVAQGTPEQIAAHQTSHTGRFLREVLREPAARA